MESSISKRNVDEGIRSQDQDQYLGGTCNVVIDKTPPRILIHFGVDLAIDHFEEEAFENVEPD